MKEQFVTYDIAVKLKELGFNESCLGRFRKIYTNKNDYEFLWVNNPEEESDIKCPLWQQAFDWAIKTHGINTLIFSDGFNWTFDLRWIHPDDILDIPTIQFPKPEKNRIWAEDITEIRKEALNKIIEIVNERLHNQNV